MFVRLLTYLLLPVYYCRVSSSVRALLTVVAGCQACPENSGNCEHALFTDHSLVVQVQQSAAYVSVCVLGQSLFMFFWLKFECQGHGSKFTVTAGN